MTNDKPRNQTPSGDQVVEALEACAGALRALELASDELEEGERGDRAEHVPRATELLRKVISELRLAEGWEPGTPTTGFIMAVREKRRRGGRQDPKKH